MSSSSTSGFTTPTRRHTTGTNDIDVSNTMTDSSNSPQSNYHLQTSNSDGNATQKEDAEFQDEYDSSDDEEEEEETALSVEELLYSMSSYHAIAIPVSTTMILAACAACFINTPQIIQDSAKEFTVYQVWKIDTQNSSNSSHSNGDNFVKSVGNTLVMVTVIGCMTFGIVLLYKYRCMKCLIGYMICSSAMLLGFMGGILTDLFLQIYKIPADVISYYIGHYNFAIVGVISIFFANEMKILPQITQFYLICSSVILAWHFSHFDEWTAWTLLVMLALYDLCAVLSPCGPLKALVNLMQSDDAPEMPGLLYEAKLNVPRPHKQQQQRSKDEEEIPPVQSSFSNASSTTTATNQANVATTIQTVEMTTNTNTATPTQSSLMASQQPTQKIREVSIPLAIAILYKLNILTSTLPPSTKKKKRIGRSRSKDDSTERAASKSPLLGESSDQEIVWKSHAEYSQRNFSKQHLSTQMVIVQLPHGNIQPVPNNSTNRPLYQIISASGQVRRIIQVDKRSGKCYEVVQNEDGEYESDDEFDQDEDGKGNSIRLGLGDFIFYSVLVAKAALYSFTTFAACMLVILAGLGGTLILLSVYHSALPALPISIFLGVLFYGLTRVAIEPYMESILQAPLYV